ncbi:MAG: flagellar basal body P-ring formation chaperone FlgA [Hyphomicrobium aestuarii]|nr:flagellar basal body P-ring formation chaperone FlgA [Hyphomicrobium aestuarii]
MRLFIYCLVAQAWFGVACASESTRFPVPSASIQPGDALTEEMVIERNLIANDVARRTHYTSRDSVVGKVARRPLVAGAAIPLNALREPQVFKEGERVTVEFRDGGLNIRAVGLALQAGVVGQYVRVRNSDTGTIVTGIVRADGTVEVQG